MLPPPLSISLQLSVKSRAALNFLTAHSGLIICALFLLAGLVLAGDYGIATDEEDQRRIAQANLNYILGQDYIIDELHILFGAAFELPLLLAERALGREDYYYIHRLRLTLTHLFFIVGAFFCYRLAYRLFDNRLIALFALLIFLLHPRLYAHSFVNSKDLPFLSMLVIALYLLERAFRRDTAGAFILLGIAVGLLTNLRIMGVMLLAAVLAMRGLDLFYAGNWPERKAILRTAGVFILAAGLTWYAATPFAWANPVDYLAASLNLTANHPVVPPWQLFQGERFPSTDLPPHYNAVWFGITTPPLIMLLGLMGISAGAAGFCRRPGSLFRNTRRRFAGLLLAAFLLPPLAAALLGSNQYDNWRHFYFIYAPFCLLAAGGLGWLVDRFSPWQPGRAGVYGLAGLGVGLIAWQLIQLHPGQHDYFNFLVDRTTPERLRTQYEMNYWQLAYREGLEYLRARHPGETLVVRGEGIGRQRKILPPAARQRLPAGGGRADYAILQPELSQPEPDFRLAYRRQIYNNTRMALRPLNAARMTPEIIAAYRELYRQATAGEPIIRADYNVYLDNRRLVFVRENCPPEEPEAWFGVRIFPKRLETLPPLLRHGYSSYAGIRAHGVRLDNLCLAVLQLPDYARDDLILFRSTVRNAAESYRPAGLPDYARDDLILFHRVSGPYRPASLPAWSELYSLSRPGLGEIIADHRRNHPPPVNQDAFKVFIDRDAGRNRLLYAKDNCTPAAYETLVTLHIYPGNRADLPAEHRDNGFDNRDFALSNYGGRPGGACIAVVFLPDYPIAAIRTGQEGIWQVNLYPPADPEQLRAAYAALSAIQLAARAVFDLYLQDGRLIYLRETCAAADTAAGFFLHIIPVEVTDLPAERRPAGFANLDFAFARYGGAFDGKCLAAVPLPEYPIKTIRTGQHIPGQGEVWAAELAGER